MLDLTSIGVGALALLAVVAAWWRDRRKGRKEGRDQAQMEALKDAQERMERGREAVVRGRDGSTPADRLRKNDGQW